MPPDLRDARLRELRFLAKLERDGIYRPSSEELRDEFFKQMIALLVFDGLINGVGSQGWSYWGQFGRSENRLPENNRLLQEIEYSRWSTLDEVLGGQHPVLRLSHKGRVRLSEL